jgi:hypothetical protein
MVYLLLQATTQPVVLDTSSLWYVLGTTLAGLLVALAEGARRHFNLQNLLSLRLAALEKKDEQQQAQLDRQKLTIKRLTRKVGTLQERYDRERVLKHFYRGKLTVAVGVIEMYRAHGRLPEDTFQWDPAEEPPDPKKNVDVAPGTVLASA